MGRSKKVTVHARGEDESTQQRFTAEVTIPEDQVWEQDTVARAVEETYGIDKGNYRVDSWSRPDKPGSLFKRGR